MYARLEALHRRRVDNQVKLASQLNEAWDRVKTSEPVRFALGAMQPIDQDYTRKSFEEADRVANQIEKNVPQSVEFDYQGSTTNDTHIKAASDIDLLTLLSPTRHFYFVEPPLTVAPGNVYTGDTLADLSKLRADCISILRDKFQTATISPGSKSIAAEGGSLARKVDVVPSAWLDSQEWQQTKNKAYRGIKVLDSSVNQLIPNKPFLHNNLLDNKDRRCIGGLRKSIRLMKSLKYDASTEVKLTSYHICAIAYNAPDQFLTVAPGHDLLLLEQTRQWCVRVRDDANLRDNMMVPNGTEKVFHSGGAQLPGLNQMIVELEGLERDILNDNRRSFAKLAEARFELPTPPQPVAWPTSRPTAPAVGLLWR
jgi:hypothetical protein